MVFPDFRKYTGRFFLYLLLFLPLQALTQNTPLFVSQEVLKIDIYTDVETILEDRGEDRDWHNALIVYMENGQQIRLDAELKSRGNFRRKKEICGFPPYKVNLKKKQIEGRLFENSDKIKLVTHCNSDDKEGNYNVLTEYLIYRIYNLVSDTSFRVRLCEITWNDILDQYRPLTRYGFFIEKTESLTDRLNLKEIEKESVSPGQLDMATYHEFAILQFLIGNTDWSVLLPQNLKMLGNNDTADLLAVPYDFDLCSLISPVYASKEHGFDFDESKPVIKAYCETLNDFEPAIREYLQKETAILTLIENFSLLSDKEKKSIVRFLKDRFSILKDREHLEEVFVNYCK